MSAPKSIHGKTFWLGSTSCLKLFCFSFTGKMMVSDAEATRMSRMRVAQLSKKKSYLYLTILRLQVLVYEGEKLLFLGGGEVKVLRPYSSPLGDVFVNESVICV